MADLAALVVLGAQAGQEQAALRPLALLAVLFQMYNNRHSEPIDPAVQEQVIALHEEALKVTVALGVEDLSAELRRSASWACNTLGNHRADEDKDHAGAVAAYTRGLAFDAANAVLLRNRAGEQFEQGDLAAAQADINAAAALEPDAPRLMDINNKLKEMRGGQNA